MADRPCSVIAIAPISRKPACATEEYAIMRLMSVWVRPITAPITIEAIATAQSTPRHSHRVSPNATKSTRRIAAERGDLGARGHERRHRGRRALVDVRGPGVERADRGLEHQADDEQRQPAEQQSVRAGRARRGGGDLGKPHRAGVAVEQREAVEEERRRERAEQEVLDRRLLREQPASAGQPAHQVQRQAEHLERDEHRQQVVGRDEGHHPAEREQRERDDLGLHRRRLVRRAVGPLGRKVTAAVTTVARRRRGRPRRRRRRRPARRSGRR